MKCAVLKRGPLTEWWTLLLSRASDKRLVRNLDCVYHCRNRFDHGCIPHLVLFLDGVVELQRKNWCFDAGLVSFGAAWPTTIRLWHCCEKHFQGQDGGRDRQITALAAQRQELWSSRSRPTCQEIGNLCVWRHGVVRKCTIDPSLDLLYWYERGKFTLLDAPSPRGGFCRYISRFASLPTKAVRQLQLTGARQAECLSPKRIMNNNNE